MSPFEARTKARRKATLVERAQSMRHAAPSSEQILWDAIRRNALGVQFRRQVPIAGLFIGDFVASEIKLVIEVDGSAHAQRSAADRRRDAKLKRLGFTVLRLAAALAERDLPEALRRIREALAAKSPAPWYAPARRPTQLRATGVDD